MAVPDQGLYLLRQLQRRRLCQQNLISFCTHALAPRSELPAAHHRRIVAELEKVARQRSLSSGTFAVSVRI
jgi:hypothetical protein